MPGGHAPSNELFTSQIARFFLDNTSDAVIALDSGRTIRTWNPAATKIYGYSLAEIAGRPVSFLFGGTAGETECRALERKLRSGDTSTGWDTTQVHKSGSAVHISLDIYPLITEDGAVPGHCIVGKETTRYRMLQSQLRRTQKLEAVGRLSGGIAHDFNNLLTVISGYNSMIMAELPVADPMMAYSIEVDKAAERATLLTNQLLSFSRREVTEPRVLNLNDMVADLDKMLRRIIGEDIRLVSTLATGLDNIKADPGQISQLMTNLVLNARDAMPGGGEITITTGTVEIEGPVIADELAPGRYVKLIISDNGAGMDEETRQHLFEPFFTTKPSGKGTGLGLSIVSGIVSQLQGDISVSTQSGRGSTFTIRLPATLEQLTERSPIPEGAASQPADPEIAVLLVEDDGGVRHLIRHMLLKRGFRVYETSDPREAARICETVPINLLLTDIIMPEMNGRDLATDLLKTHVALRVLYMSGYLDDSIIPPSLLERGFHFLRKPFTAAHLYRQIETMFNVRSEEPPARTPCSDI